MKYYSIRVVGASSIGEACEKVIEGDFVEDDDLSDAVMTEEELLDALGGGSIALELGEFQE